MIAMNQPATAEEISSGLTPEKDFSPAAPPRERGLLRALMVLAVPVLIEQMLHTVVGLTDTWLANNLPGKETATAATTAVGNISYVLWFVGLIVSAVGTGSTALIARAKGARHRRLANGVCGQSVTASVFLGLALGVVMYALADPLISAMRLSDQARDFAGSYLRMLTFSLPLMTLMFTANACLRGAGDTVTPAIAMCIVDVVNVALSFSLTYGIWGMPKMGFEGIAMGTVIAYAVGGLLQFGVLLSGRGGVRLHLHRLRPHWHTMRRVLRIGIPSGLEGLLIWVANFTVVIVINQMDKTNVSAAAHMNAVKIESLSYLPGFAFAMAAATLTGQALGAKNPRRAAQSTYLAYAVGGGVMTAFGLVFILFGKTLATWMMPNLPETAELTGQCLRLAGFIQFGFAASMIFSGALRGAGDTMAVMKLNLASILGVRLVGVLVVVFGFGGGVVAVWGVLCGELILRGLLAYLRFARGKWKQVEV